jgi:hypothetical protein
MFDKGRLSVFIAVLGFFLLMPGSGFAQGTETANYVTKYGGTPVTFTTNSLIYDNGTYVGIGTTTPAFNLDIISQVDPAAVTVEG